MCLITEQTKPEITTEDMVVYKVLSNSWSQCYPTIWNKGKLKKAKLGIKNVDTYDWEPSWAYADEFASLHYCGMGNVTCIAEGLHAFCTKSRIQKGNWKDGTIHKMLIPAGSKIFKDSTGLIVSNQMILIK